MWLKTGLKPLYLGSVAEDWAKTSVYWSMAEDWAHSGNTAEENTFAMTSAFSTEAHVYCAGILPRGNAHGKSYYFNAGVQTAPRQLELLKHADRFISITFTVYYHSDILHRWS